MTKPLCNTKPKRDLSKDFRKAQPAHLCTSAVLNTRISYHPVSAIKTWQPTEQVR